MVVTIITKNIILWKCYSAFSPFRNLKNSDINLTSFYCIPYDTETNNCFTMCVLHMTKLKDKKCVPFTSRAPSSLQACNLKLVAPTEAIT
jgi:hypothetical protein